MPIRSLELLLDAETEQVVLGDWQRLIEADLPSAGRHQGTTNRPHLTLVAGEEPYDLDALAEAARTGSIALPVAAPLGGLLLFGPHRGHVVLGRAVVVTDALLALHRAVHAAAGGAPAPNARPDAWTPHVTLARRVAVAELPAMLEVLGGSRMPEWSRAVGLRMWDAGTKTVTDLVGGP